MTFGARPFGSRSFGDSAPVGAGIMPATTDGGAGAPVTGSGTITAVGLLTGMGRSGVRGSGLVLGGGHLVGAGTPILVAGSVRISARGGVYGGSSDPGLYSTTPGTTTVDRVGNVIHAGPDGAREAYRLVVVKRNGERIAELPDAVVGDIGEELNGVGTTTFNVSKRDSAAISSLTVPDTEIQVWRGRMLAGWFVVIKAETQGDFVKFQCKDLAWYFTKRFIGKADRTNYIKNWSFEQDKAYWYRSFNALRPVAQIPGEEFATIDSTNAYTGKKALVLSQTSRNSEVIDFGYAQNVDWTADPNNNPNGELWTVSAWLFVSDFQAPALNTRGLVLSRFSTTEFITSFSPYYGGNIDQPKNLGVSNVPIDENTPRNTWVRMEAEILQPPNVAVAETIKVELSAIKGTVRWDEVTLTRKEILGFWNVEQANILKGIIEHAQSVDYAKSDLLIGTNCIPTGVKRTREYVMSEHPLVGEAIDEFPTLHNGMDWSIETTATSRTFTSHFPYRGRRRKKIRLELGYNVVDYSLSIDGERTANSVVVLGDGDGSDREEGMYQDPTAFSDGLILEEVYNATPGSTIQTLDDQARRGVDRFKHPMKILEMTLHESSGALIPKLKTGDVVRCVIDDGWAQIDEEFRIITRKLNPATDRLVVTLNPVTEEFPE